MGRRIRTPAWRGHAAARSIAGMFDVAVIGAGIVGASAAFRLSEAGRSVVVLEAGTPAGKTTGNSFAWLNAVSKEPEAYHRLNALGMEEHRRIAADAGAAGIACGAPPPSLIAPVPRRWTAQGGRGGRSTAVLGGAGRSWGGAG